MASARSAIEIRAQQQAITDADRADHKSNVDATASGESEVFLWDDLIPEFGLKVTPAGSKVYLYQYRMHGGRAAKVERDTIGKYEAFSPDQTRIEANHGRHGNPRPPLPLVTGFWRFRNCR